MGNQVSGTLVQRITSVLAVLIFFYMPLVMFSIESPVFPTVGVLFTAMDLANGFSIEPLGFLQLHFLDWSSPNALIWLLLVPAVYGWFAIEGTTTYRRRELGVGAILVVVALLVLVMVAFSLSSVTRDIEDAILGDIDNLSIFPSDIYRILDDNKTRLTLELGYGWWYLIIIYVLMGLNLLRELVAAGSQIVQMARGSVANVVSGMVTPAAAPQGTTTQPFASPSTANNQTLEQKLDRLRKLHESGAISDAEYDATRQQYLDEI
jgi:hypothetical protein